MQPFNTAQLTTKYAAAQEKIHIITIKWNGRL